MILPQRFKKLNCKYNFLKSLEFKLLLNKVDFGKKQYDIRKT